MNTHIAKWGQSFAVRIPKGIAERAALHEGDKLDVSVTQDGAIVLRPSRRKYSLEELVSDITPENRHPEIDWGEPVGGEAW